jgi:hypothetical protein
MARVRPALKRRFLQLVVSTTAAVLVLSGTAQPAVAAPIPIPEDDPFYAAPANLAAMAPGTVLASRPVAVRAFELPVPADAWQIKYRTSDRTGRPTVTVTTLLVPRSPWTKTDGPRPLVSYQTAEDGVSTRCAPSYALRAGISGGFSGSYSESPIIVTALLQGWAVSVPDYEGMRSEFLVAATEAKGVLDGLRAARNFAPAGLQSSPVALWGYSGGAFATANAAQLQARYAPELPIRAVSLGGLLGSVRATIDAFDGSIAGGAIPMGMHGFARSYPGLHIRDRLSPSGQEKYDTEAADCLFDAAARYPFLKVSQIEGSPGTLDQPDIAAMLRSNSPLYRPGVPTAAVYEYHTRFDEFAPIGPARATLRNYCAAGVPVQYAEKLVGEHLTEIVLGIPGVVGFLTRRFAGEPPRNNCASIPR